jgi:hypothetical protein
MAVSLTTAKFKHGNSTEGSQNRQDSKIWPWVQLDSEPRITVLARANSNLAVSHSVGSLQQNTILSPVGFGTTNDCGGEDQ